MAQSSYTLYHNPFSICSIMVRQTIAIRGEPKDEASKVPIEEKIIELFNEEQFCEHYLCEVNPEGQVPVLASTSLDKSICDSLEITHFLAQRYPSLMPAEHKEEMTQLLKDLHALNYFSLSFPGREYVAEGFKESVFKRLEGDISDRYRNALTFKLGVLERDKVRGLKPSMTETMNGRAKTLMEKFEAQITWPPSRGAKAESWIFDLPHATALDAHLAVFIARMLDVGRENIIPDKLKKYAERVTQTVEWNSVMQGRRTMVARK